ncbi:MAG: hypothetical protein WD906_06345 [Anaerolineales bacterium]
MPELPHGLTPLEIGGGKVDILGAGAFRLVIPPTSKYADAQVDDHRTLARGSFPHQPGFSMRLRAAASHAQPRGTLGFGLWNDPFAASLGQAGAGRRLPVAPRAIWFFYASDPSDLPLMPGLPGSGWKASSLDAPHIPALLLAPLAIGAIALAKFPWTRRPVMRRALRSIRAAEAVLTNRLDQEHEVELAWTERGVDFRVDGGQVLHAPHPPPGPLGFVAWIDNQYGVASPERGFGFGVVPTVEEQWLEIRGLEISEG